jgi:hypothetical protein
MIDLPYLVGQAGQTETTQIATGFKFDLPDDPNFAVAIQEGTARLAAQPTIVVRAVAVRYEVEGQFALGIITEHTWGQAEVVRDYFVGNMGYEP